jgi:hypothetical protein
MTNVSITKNSVDFTSTASGWLLLTEPRWEQVDEASLHLATEQGVYLITLTEHSINGTTYTSSSDAIAYLNNL